MNMYNWIFPNPLTHFPAHLMSHSGTQRYYLYFAPEGKIPSQTPGLPSNSRPALAIAARGYNVRVI